MKDLHDFRTHELQRDLCSHWRHAAKHGTWANTICFIQSVSWLAQHPYSKFIGDPKVRQSTINNLLFLQSIAEQRALTENPNND